MTAPINIPGYHIERQLGSGGMACVYLATQESLLRKVALKIMNPALASDRSCCERFIKEGRIIAELVHPNIVTVHDVGMAGSQYYLAMEFLPNGTLSERIVGGLGPDEALRILTLVAGALRLAHLHDVVHRDIKPANILFRDVDTPVLSDFGVAKATRPDTQMTIVGSVIGTPDYMSPEQALGETVDARSDLYSLGVVFFEMLTGEHPFRSGNPQATAILNRINAVPQLPTFLSRYQPIIDGLMAGERSRRFADVDALLAALEREQLLPTAAQPGRPSAVTHPVGPAMDTTAALGTRQERLASPDVSKSENKPAPPLSRWRVRLLGVGALSVAVAIGAYVFLTPNHSRVKSPVLSPGQPQTLPSSPATAGEVDIGDSAHLDPETQAKVDRLLLAAEGHLLMARLTEPPGSNAADAFQRVLEIDPHNLAARAGLKHIADTYAEMAKQSLQAGRLQEGYARIETGLRVEPDHAALLALQKQADERPTH
ncbi:MAG: protein kinase [Nitrospirota bacterium]